jgi:hypothetical protein
LDRTIVVGGPLNSPNLRQSARPAVPVAERPGIGELATLEEIAAVEKINASYVGHVLRLTLLAPDIVEAILNGRHPAEMLAVLMRPFAVGWWGAEDGDQILSGHVDNAIRRPLRDSVLRVPPNRPYEQHLR